jgi:C4-dicarboxylate-specific signal transduction histidine kinase
MTGKPVKNKLVGVRPPAGGDLTRMLISAELILKSDGSLDLLICTYYGVNERKRMEDRLREARDEVEQRVLERTAEPLKAKEAAEAMMALITGLL